MRAWAILYFSTLLLFKKSPSCSRGLDLFGYSVLLVRFFFSIILEMRESRLLSFSFLLYVDPESIPSLTILDFILDIVLDLLISRLLKLKSEANEFSLPSKF